MKSYYVNEKTCKKIHVYLLPDDFSLRKILWGNMVEDMKILFTFYHRSRDKTMGETKR